MAYNPTLNVEKVVPDPIEVKDMEVGAVHQLADALEYRGQREQLSIRDTAIFEVFKHGLRSMEISNLNIGNYSGQSLEIIGPSGRVTAKHPLRRMHGRLWTATWAGV